ncbi:hypothetical protein BCR33DRAFT_790054 [Rhizoclosmatium globosum]|uniref:Uncharacterized protein n=1 Tax=Rhizoclosmatium globosum TaxID=329046 RepID=A0A1Y2BQ82_9FUNG|nr:hypothetical protein BCR33DRAFT_790054 [Rhizoclosmatium globosum]|eukprot:ORY36898.1 hypothetical protein BCR33DRAFT_790054 [Rhizoclosmatium globosum]
MCCLFTGDDVPGPSGGTTHLSPYGQQQGQPQVVYVQAPPQQQQMGTGGAMASGAAAGAAGAAVGCLGCCALQELCLCCLFD